MTKKFVIYRRLSKEDRTKTQHGFESQLMDINFYLEGLDSYEVVGSFKEFISGAADVKPELEKALELCRETGSVLLISKLDRLSRRVAQVATYMESDVNFKVSTYPSATNMMLHIMSVMAEEERAVIAARVKRGLAVVKRDTPEKLAKGKDSQWSKTFRANKAAGLHKSTRNREATKKKLIPVINAVKDMISFSNDNLTQRQIAVKLQRKVFFHQGVKSTVKQW